MIRVWIRPYTEDGFGQPKTEWAFLQPRGINSVMQRNLVSAFLCLYSAAFLHAYIRSYFVAVHILDVVAAVVGGGGGR